MDYQIAKPTSYEQVIEKRGGKFFNVLYMHVNHGRRSIQYVELRTEKSIPTLRKEGEKLAKRNGVPFSFRDERP